MAEIYRQFEGTRYHTVQLFGDSFREGGAECFQISCPSLLPADAALTGFGQSLWQRHFDPEMTLAPGVRRTFVDADGQVQGFYGVAGHRRFLLASGALKAWVEVMPDGWSVELGGAPAARLQLRQPPQPCFWTAGDAPDWNPCYHVDLLTPVAEPLLPYLLSIPLLGFPM